MFKSAFEKVLDKATSPLNVEPELTSLIQLCDFIRSGDVAPKIAIGAIKKKLDNTNQHIVQHALVILESCAKNCGAQFHEEMATRDFNDFIKDFVRRGKISDQARTKMLELIQSWQQGFRQKPEFHIFTETYNELKTSGMQFPAIRESDAMFDSASAPSWKDSAQCYRCRTAFGTITRKHHCRNCGQVFCNDCTSRYCPIPKFGIEKDVRVCDKCYDELHAATKRAARGSPERERSASASQNGSSATPATAPNRPVHKPSEADLKAEEEFETQLAIALSLSAQEEAKKQQDRRLVAEYLSHTVDSPASESGKPQAIARTEPVYSTVNGNQGSQPATLDTRDMDAELAMYLNRNFWQQRSEQLNANAPAATPSAPVQTPKASVAGSIDVPFSSAQSRAQAPSVGSTDAQIEEPPADGTIDELSSPVSTKKAVEEDQFIDAMRKTILIFTNRVRSNRVSVRNVGDDTSVQSLFMTLCRMLPELKALKDRYAARKAYYEALQDKLNEIRDGRQVLDAMRSEAAERRRRAEEEAVRQRQLEMLAKLEQFRAYKQQMLANTLRMMEEQQRFGSLYGPPVGPNAVTNNPNYMSSLPSSQSQYSFTASGQPVAPTQYGYAPAPAYSYAAPGQPATFSSQPNLAIAPEYPPQSGTAPYAAGWPTGGPPPTTSAFPSHSQPQPHISTTSVQPSYAHSSMPTSVDPVAYQPATQAPYTQPTSQPVYAQPQTVQAGYTSPPNSHPSYASTASYGYQQTSGIEQQPQGYGAPPPIASATYGAPAAPHLQDVTKPEEQLISFD